MNSLLLKVGGYLLVTLFIGAGGYFKGKHDEQLKVAHQVNEVMHNELKKREATEDRIRFLEEQLEEKTQRFNQLAYELKEKTRVKTSTIVANHASGTKRLSVPVKSDGCPAPARPETPKHSTRAPAHGRAELSPEAGEFLIREAARADALTIERNQCIALLKEYKGITNKYLNTVRDKEGKK